MDIGRFLFRIWASLFYELGLLHGGHDRNSALGLHIVACLILSLLIPQLPDSSSVVLRICHRLCFFCSSPTSNGTLVPRAQDDGLKTPVAPGNFPPTLRVAPKTELKAPRKRAYDEDNEDKQSAILDGTRSDSAASLAPKPKIIPSILKKTKPTPALEVRIPESSSSDERSPSTSDSTSSWYMLSPWAKKLQSLRSPGPLRKLLPRLVSSPEPAITFADKIIQNTTPAPVSNAATPSTPYDATAVAPDREPGQVDGSQDPASQEAMQILNELEHKLDGFALECRLLRRNQLANTKGTDQEYLLLSHVLEQQILLQLNEVGNEANGTIRLRRKDLVRRTLTVLIDLERALSARAETEAIRRAGGQEDRTERHRKQARKLSVSYEFQSSSPTACPPKRRKLNLISPRNPHCSSKSRTHTGRGRRANHSSALEQTSPMSLDTLTHTIAQYT